MNTESALHVFHWGVKLSAPCSIHIASSIWTKILHWSNTNRMFNEPLFNIAKFAFSYVHLLSNTLGAYWSWQCTCMRERKKKHRLNNNLDWIRCSHNCYIAHCISVFFPVKLKGDTSKVNLTCAPTSNVDWNIFFWRESERSRKKFKKKYISTNRFDWLIFLQFPLDWHFCLFKCI